MPNFAGFDDLPSCSSFLWIDELEFGPDGSLYILATSSGSDAIFRLDSQNNLIHVAGCGAAEADGLPADQVHLYDAIGMAFDSNGRIFVAERSMSYHPNLRMIDTDGTITTVRDEYDVNDITHMSMGPGDELYLLGRFPDVMVKLKNK